LANVTSPVEFPVPVAGVTPVAGVMLQVTVPGVPPVIEKLLVEPALMFPEVVGVITMALGDEHAGNATACIFMAVTIDAGAQPTGAAAFDERNVTVYMPAFANVTGPVVAPVPIDGVTPAEGAIDQLIVPGVPPVAVKVFMPPGAMLAAVLAALIVKAEGVVQAGGLTVNMRFPDALAEGVQFIGVVLFVDVNVTV
jgi:hypothetical protein